MCAVCINVTSLEIWEPQPPGTLTVCPGLYRGCFTFFTCILWTAVAQWLKLLVRSQLVSVDFSSTLNPSDRTMALGSTQPTAPSVVEAVYPEARRHDISTSLFIPIWGREPSKTERKGWLFVGRNKPTCLLLPVATSNDHHHSYC